MPVFDSLIGSHGTAGTSASFRTRSCTFKPIVVGTIEEKLRYLRRNPLFDKAGDNMLRECAAFLTLCRRSSRMRLFYQGAAGDLVFLLSEGCVRLSRLLENGREMITVIGPGDMFGEDALFAPVERSREALAIDDVVLFSIRAANLVALMARQPLLALNIVRYLQKQRDEANSTIEEIAYLTVGERLVRLMRRLADKHGIAEESGIRIDLPLTHADIASLIGSTRETVSLQLAHLAKVGRVVVRDHAFLVPRLQP